MSSLLFPETPEGASACFLEEHSLARAFASFTEAASSLERSYTQLQQEVTRLRQELQQTNQDLARSLDETHRTRQHLNRILEGLPCGVLVVEAEGRVSITNPELHRLLGTGCKDPLPPSVRAWLETGDPRGSELEYRRPDNTLEWIALRRAQLGIEDGGSSIYILQDVTALKHLQREHELFRRRQALAEMSAVLAHEIRNPLASMELFAGLLADAATSSEQKEWIGHLLAGLRTLGATVNNVLHWHSEPQLQMTPVDLGRLLEWLSDFLRPLAERTEVQITLENDLAGVVIEADRHRLEQVLLNLGLNAVRFMPHGGRLILSGRSDAGIAELEVTDTGSGIAAEHLEQIFCPGFSTSAGSPGLGLAVCKKIVEQHGGALRVASSPGRSTTFTLELRRTCP